MGANSCLRVTNVHVPLKIQGPEVFLQHGCKVQLRPDLIHFFGITAAPMRANEMTCVLCVRSTNDGNVKNANKNVAPGPSGAHCVVKRALF